MNRLVEPLSAVLDRAPPSWAPLIDDWRRSPDGRRLEAFVAARQAERATIYPSAVLRALEATPLERVRVVVLGQDPYHREGQAEGLAFSVPRGQRPPPSLRNIFGEIQRDLGLALPPHGHLGRWTERGVLLLNTVLTVEEASPRRHAKQGWEALTDKILVELAENAEPKVFMLWGASAHSYAALARASGRHAVLLANHPSPLSARRGPLPFVGCGHFGAANRFFAGHGLAPVDWSLAEPEPGR